MVRLLLTALLFLSLALNGESQPLPPPSPSPTQNIEADAPPDPETNVELESIDSEGPPQLIPETPWSALIRNSRSEPSEGVVVETLPLFRVAGTASLNAQDRAALVQDRVQRVIDEHGTDPPPVVVDQLAGATVIRAGDQILITVTNEDLPEFNLAELPSEVRRQLEVELATSWRDSLQNELDLAATMRTPAYRWFALSLVLVMLAAATISHGLLSWAGKRLLGSPFWSAKFLLWAGFVYMSLRLFPGSRTWAGLVYRGVLYPYLLLVVVFIITLLVSRLMETMVHRYFLALQQNQEAVHLSRLGQRLATLDQAARVTVRVLVFVVGMITYLVLLEVDLGAALAGAGLLGVTVGLATQDLIKNVLGGVHILLEDHFGIGDVIEWDGLSGTVEAFHLRCTQVRTIDGRLITIPNASLQVVQNHSNVWGRVDFRVQIAYRESIERALGVLEEVADELAQEWEDQITEPPGILGVEQLGENGVTLRLLLRTIPLSQWAVKRELNRRVKDRFDLEGIEIPLPQRRVLMLDPLDPGGDPKEQAPKTKKSDL